MVLRCSKTALMSMCLDSLFLGKSKYKITAHTHRECERFLQGGDK